MREYFTKIVVGTISEEEMEDLERLLKNDDNRNLFENHVRDYYDLNRAFQSKDHEEAFSRVLSKLEKKEKSVIKLIPNWLKYAAAIIILVATGYFLTINQFTSKQEIVEINNNIEIGSDKAILTLENGENIALEKGKVYESNKVNSNGEELVYNNANTAKPELEYNYLSIPRGGEFFMELSDGTKVWINSDTKIKYPVAFYEGEPRKVELLYGEAYFDVSPSTKHSGDSFKVITQSQVIEVLGTEFNVKAYKDEELISTTLVEGKVTIEVDNITETLKPSQQARYTANNKHFEIIVVDAKAETSWRNGVFTFESKSLKDIMTVLSRWYDTEVIFTNKDLENIKFNGVLNKNQNIEEILITIKNTKIINEYEITDSNQILLK